MQQSDSQKFGYSKPLSQSLGKNEKCRQPMVSGAAGLGQAVGSATRPTIVANEKRGVAWLVKPAGEEICVAKLSDDELYQKCRQYGMNAKVWLRKFAGLLPEVAKRGLHRRKGFISIGEFAGKLAGMSEYAVDRILQLHAKIKDKPALLKLFESGAEGWSKIAKVAYVSTTETDKEWAEKVTLLSTRALEAFVQNYRLKSVHVNEKENKSPIGQGVTVTLPLSTDGGLLPSSADGNNGVSGIGSTFDSDGTGLPFGQSLPPLYEPPVRFSFPASKDVEFDLRLAKQKLEKQSKQVLSWNEAFKMLVQKSDLATGKNVHAFTGKDIPENSKSNIDQKRPGFCSKCCRKANIQNLPICDECMKKP